MSGVLNSHERRMLKFINAWTDLPDWTSKLQDPALVASWREAISAGIKPEHFDYCIEELKIEAERFLGSHIAPALDNQEVVVKSDDILSDSLRCRLAHAYAHISGATTSPPVLDPHANGNARSLINPSHCPLVWGRSRFHEEGLPTNLGACLSHFSGAGTVIPDDPYSFERHKRQWLPCDISLIERNNVRVDSIINGLHPRRFPSTYRLVEDLVAATIPAWERCLEIRFPRTGVAGCDWGLTRPKLDESEDAYLGALRQGLRLRSFQHRERLNDLGLRKHLATESHVDLRKEYRQLQVIVAMDGVELSPENGESYVGSWRLDKPSRKHVVATAIFYFDWENISTGSLEFHQCLHERRNIFEDLGEVEIRNGRLVAFSGRLKYRESAFERLDKTRPGHCRFLTLRLVDPTRTVLSTAQVAPQQRSWWIGETIRRTINPPSNLCEVLALIFANSPKGSQLPLELLEMISAFLQEDKDWLISDNDDTLSWGDLN